MNTLATPTRIMHIPAVLAGQLDTLGVAFNSNAETLAFDALQRYIAEESDFAARVQKSLSQADRGEFVPEEQVTAFFAKYGC